MQTTLELINTVDCESQTYKTAHYFYRVAQPFSWTEHKSRMRN